MELPPGDKKENDKEKETEEEKEKKEEEEQEEEEQIPKEKEKENVAPAVTMKPRLIYGLRTDVVGNVQFNLQNEVIYPVEAVLAFHDFIRNRQRFLRLPEDTYPDVIAISNNRKWLAVIETCTKPGSGSGVALYELASLKKRRYLELPHQLRGNQVMRMRFTADAKTIAILTKPPGEIFILMSLDKLSTVLESRPTLSAMRGTLSTMAVHPMDHTVFAVGGDCLLMFLSKSEKGISISNNVKVHSHITSMTFFLAEFLIAGTSDDELLLFENGDIKQRQQASSAEFFDVLWDQETLNREMENYTPFDQKLHNRRVVNMTSFTRGFCYVMFNCIYVFERVSKYRMERKTILSLPYGIYPEHSYQITNLAIDHRQETVVVTTRHAQIYAGVLIVPETLKVRLLKLQPLGVMLHVGDIIHMSVCAWKPIIMTASKDQTVRIWNYETETVELVRKFQVDVNIVELNSTGLMAAIGFTDQLRVTQIFMDELNIVKTYNFPLCKDVKYSNYGHFMAVAYDNIISITSVYKLDIIISLRGHNGAVLSIAWSRDDRYLVSGGAEGAIYQWDVVTGDRLQEIVQKGTEYRSLCVTNTEPLSIYAATNLGVLREFQNSEIVREIAVPSLLPNTPLTSMALARSDLIMFVGTETGELFNVQLPFMDAGGASCINYRFFTSKINKLAFTYDGTMLVAISKNGTLSVWTLENIDGKVAHMDSDLLRSQEILIPRSILKEKNEQIINLELRLRQQSEEFQYQLNQNEIFDGQQLAEVHRSYCEALEELKKKNNEIEQRHTEEMNQITFQINDLRDEHRKQLEHLADQYSERMLVEYQKFSNLRDSMLTLREGYENKLKSSAGILQDTVEGLETDYKRQMDERKELMRSLMQEMQDKRIEFFEYCYQVETENDRNMIEMQLKYENKLSDEQNETQLWRGKAGVLDKKYQILNKEVEKLLEDVETLKEEHAKSQRNIARLNHAIDDLTKDISDRDYAIGSKEKRIQELLHKNQELDKYKQVLSHKISELKAQIEPREFQINEKRKHILELENELEGLNQNNIQLELQLKELKDKYLSNVSELNLERHRSRAGRECIQNICTEIYHVAGLINNPHKLKVAVKKMFERHASDDELKRHISLDAEVRDEFQRQRAQIERVLKIYKNRDQDLDQKKKYDKLFNENFALMKEVEELQAENSTLRTQVKRNISRAKAKSISNKLKKQREGITEQSSMSLAAEVSQMSTQPSHSYVQINLPAPNETF